MSSSLNKIGVSANSTKTGVRTLRQETAMLNRSSLSRIGGAFSGLMRSVAPIVLVTTAVTALTRAVTGSQAAYNTQAISEKQLETIMRQRIGATDDQIDSIKRLASAQQKIGIIGDEIQLSGVQQLTTFLKQKDSIDTLLPAMNNLLAQQRGFKATTMDAVNIGNLMGKVLQGQTAALTRVGITFTEDEERLLKFGNEQQRAATLARVITNNVGEMNKALAQTPEGRLKQNANDMGDVQERFGRLIVSIKSSFSPITEMFISGANRLMDFFEMILPALKTFNEFLAAPITTIRKLTDKISTDFPITTGIILAATAAVVGYKLAMLSLFALQAIIAGLKSALAAYEIIVFAVKNATSLWAAAQWLLNAALGANPVGVIVAAVAALIAVIAFLIVKIGGWGEAWKHTVNGAKLVWRAYVEYVKSNFNTVVQGIMIGINKIKEGWYKFKEAVGIGDSSKNREMLAQIQADTEARQKSIAAGYSQVVELAKQAGSEFKNAAGSFSWGKPGISAAVIPGAANAGALGTGGLVGGGNASGSDAGKETANSIATGGTKTTHVTVNIGEMGNDMKIYVGSVKEGAEKIRDAVLDQLTRALSMAQGQTM
jgi:hypothetical protein